MKITLSILILLFFTFGATADEATKEGSAVSAGKPEDETKELKGKRGPKFRMKAQSSMWT